MKHDQIKSAFIFLNGHYDPARIGFYQTLLGSFTTPTYIVAADGALTFLMKHKIKPDLIIGDMDSVSESQLASTQGSEILRFPKDKDFTDGELAIRHCLDRKIKTITLLGALDTGQETDHMLGNIFNLALAQRLARKQSLEPFTIKIQNEHQEIYYLENASQLFLNRKGAMLSIIPLDATIQICYDGFVFPKDRHIITGNFGESKTLRNQIDARQAQLSISGRALVTIRHTAE